MKEKNYKSRNRGTTINPKKRGFTLVEIMIVVVIVGLLAAMAVPTFQKVRQSSRMTLIKNNTRQIVGAANQYCMAEGVLEVELDELIGPANYIVSLSLAGQEAYPELIALGTPYVVSNTPEGDYSITP